MPRRAPLFPALSQRRIAERLCAWSDPGPARYPAPLLLAFHGLGQHAGLAERGIAQLIAAQKSVLAERR